MKRKFTTSFKIQAVEKALSRNENTTLTEIANTLGIGASTLSKWIVKASNQEFETASHDEIVSMSNDKRPQDWTSEERFNMVEACASLSGEALNAHCRMQGIYPHHVKQWKLDFIKGHSPKQKAVSPSEINTLKRENKLLIKALNRKDKALAETAALLVLKKKVHEIWGKRRGQLTSGSERQTILRLVKEATDAGARQEQACGLIGMSAKTLQRWSQQLNDQDGRREAIRSPQNKLTARERQRILKVVNEPEFAHLPASQIVPILADKEIYIGSESTIYRILKKEKQLQHRLKDKPARTVIKPKSLTAVAPNQVYTWDITYLPTRVKGSFFTYI